MDTASHVDVLNMRLRQLNRPLFCLLALMLIIASSWGQPTGSSPGREAACKREELPERYRQFLNTSFIGPPLKIDVGAVNYTYHRFGPLAQTKSTAKPLVMIAGVRCTLSTWTPDLLKNLAATREVVVFDNKGVGFSYDAEWPGDVSIQSYAESTVALISALELEEPDVLGWSMGGVIALWMATHFSNEVHRFVIVNSAAGPLPDTAVPEPPHTTPSLDLGRVTQLDPTAIFPDTPAGNAALCRYIRLVEGMPKDGVTEKQVELQWKALIEFFKAGGVVPLLANISNPTLMVVGTKAGEGPASYDILSKISNSALLAYGDAAHGAIFQHSLSAAAAISNFLDSEFE